MTDYLPKIETYLGRLKAAVDSLDRGEISLFANLLVETRDRGATVYTMGNGGSAMTASHFAVDFDKGLSYGKAKRFRMICLADNVGLVTAYANDVAYSECFVEQLRNFLSPGDLVIGISGSGNSENVIKAVEYANSSGAVTVGITGYDGGRLKRAAMHGVHVPVADMQIVEDLHMVLDHLLYNILGCGS